MRCGGAIGTYTAQQKILRWDIFSSLPNTSCKGEYLWYAFGLMRMSVVTCTMACLQTEVVSFVLIINGLEINYRCFISDSTKPFVCVHGQ